MSCGVNGRFVVKGEDGLNRVVNGAGVVGRRISFLRSEFEYEFIG